jgi:gliding motility-associated-like protein
MLKTLFAKRKIQVLLMLSFCSFLQVSAQSVTPGVSNAAGGSSTINDNVYEWSIGEMALVESMIRADLTVTNGLLQPQKVSPVLAEAFKIIPSNILSPNNDGENDTWVIQFLADFPDNEVFVYDRAGRIVFQAKNYQNNWTGKLGELDLVEDSYLYVIKLKRGDLTGMVKGYVTIVR